MTEEARSELVEARELTEWDDRDKFRHKDLADQLADLAVTVPTPANIALYGPWGSGKTGVGNLIEQRLSQAEFRDAHRHCDAAKYVRFDAFKYAETPLRRHFLSQIADQLLNEADAKAFRERLYQSEVTSRVNFEQLKNGRVVGAFVLILGLGLLLAGLAAAAAAGIAVWVSGDGDPGFFDRALSYFSSAVGFSFAPAAVLGGLFALAGNTLPVTRTKDSPSSDEQFEDQFRELLKDAKTQRLVVFVDELDRCSPHQVVDILDTIRTFLDVKGTVFIVAADQNVLERALTERVRQTTPPDTSNPYYSTGSAYLDKVFHYQTSLPPLLPGRITRYAVDLVKGRPGLWSDPAIDVDWLVSVLIPTHVRSPRRVKTLVNNYVLAFRLAQQRHAAGHLMSPPAERALELAKLVTLRTEFPRFARDLPLSSRLPELLLALAENGDMTKPSEVSPEVWAKAKVFAFGEEAVAVMLADESEDDSDEADANEEGEEDSRQRPQGTNGVEPTSEARAQGAATSTSAAMLQQLVHYLKKTQHIENPHRDLIFLEAQGNLFDLDESIAEKVEDAAVGGRTEELVASVDDLDSGAQTNVVRFLAQQTREATPGLEGQNLVEGLLAVAGSRLPEVIEPCADEAIEAVNVHGNYRNLSERSLPGALRLAVGTSRDGTDLVHHVLAHPAVRTNADLSELILEFGDHLVDHDDVVGEVAARRLVSASTTRAAVRTIQSLNRRGDLLTAALESLTALLDAASETDQQDPSDDTHQQELSEPAAALSEACDEAASLAAHEVVAFLVRAAFSADYSRYWEIAGSCVHALDDSVQSTLARELVLHRASDVTPPVMAIWLKALPRDFAASDDRRAQATDAIAHRLWESRAELGTDCEDHDTDFVAALRELAGVAGGGAADRRVALVDFINDSLRTGPDIAIDADEDFAHAWSHLRRFVDEGAVAPGAAATVVARRLVEAFGYAPAPPQRTVPAEAAQAVLRSASLWIAEVGTPEDVQSISAAIVASTWIPDIAARQVVLLMAATNHERNPGGISTPYTAAEIAQLAATDPAGSAGAVSAWLREFAQSPSDVNAVLRQYHANYSRIRQGVLAYVERVDTDARFALAEHEIHASEDEGRDLHVRLLEDVRFSDSDERSAADLLIAEYARSGSRNQRRRELIDAWKVLGPRSPQVRRALIEGITLPTLEAGGQEGFRVVFREIGLLADPAGVKTRLKQALRQHAADSDRGRLEAEMGRLRITRKERSGLLGLREREVDED